ncbi:nuclear GTPase SLIP-GC-like isoform X3 [Labrus mixtus]|uniref:nuclear GTPase SLIP-GC-like isoform X3 n=1 Tax=Labrus mixtus TaxID=508554 RepID=UPI0029BFCEB4|nr:nuclear GTPase SLIP-GC-like isoform X3 [Labrus mixtus]
MDDFVKRKLTEWRLSDWIENFQDQGIDEESFYLLDKDDIKDLITKVGPRAKFKKRLKSLKGEKNATNQEHEETADSAQVLANSNTRDKGKRKSEPQGESSGCLSPTKKRRRDSTYSEKVMLSEVRNIMECVHDKILHREKTKLNAFLEERICDLETEKRELVGVFGRTGAGKSSLINAVVGEKDLLPSGSVSACTTVIIKVEANKQNQNYEAEIEFITKEELKQELWYLSTFILNDEDCKDEDADDYNDAVEMLSALYGEERRKNPSVEHLMNDKHFREIPEFIVSKKKTLTCGSAKELSAELVKYTRSSSKYGMAKGIKKWFWPVVKCVTIRVPNNDLLQNVTLVDLPGNGDRNKGRDKMWKGVVQSCSTVWIVTDINRAASEKEPWEILKSASSLIGNGGQCQHIHFICTKSDVIEDSDDSSVAGVRAAIFKRNMRAKEEVRREFRKLKGVQTHFSDDCFKVFTVSSKEFLKKKRLGPDETEVPKLQEFLYELNDFHSVTLKYVSGAYGILSLIQGASCGEVAGVKANVCKDLEENLKCALDKVFEPMIKSYRAFNKCLMEGVEKSNSSRESDLKSFLYPKRMKGSALYGRLKCIVANNGVYKPKKGKQQNLNERLASKLMESIDEEFRKTFPNESKCEPFNGAISSFSLVTGTLVEKYKKYKGVQLQLEFLRTEEEKIKAKLDKTIRERKKEIYSSLTTSIEENMQKCYEDAQQCKGKGSLNAMRDIIEQHVRAKVDMFEESKTVMMLNVAELVEVIQKILMETLLRSMNLSLNTDDQSVPDVKEELETVTKKYKALKKNTHEGTSPVSADQPGPSSAQVSLSKKTAEACLTTEDPTGNIEKSNEASGYQSINQALFI